MRLLSLLKMLLLVVAASAQWFINGQPASHNTLGPRQQISEDGLDFTGKDVCRDCTGQGDHITDLMNVQCMSINEHNLAFC